MTAPTRTRAKAASAPPKRTGRGGDASPDKRTRQRPAATGSRSSSAERAYARRAARAEYARRTSSGDSEGKGERARRLRRFRPRLPSSRTGFVLMIMALLAGGVVATLWLSTQTIAGSYKLEHLREKNGALAEQAAQLQRVVTKRESATWLAEQAKELGMVQGGFPAKLVVNPDGSVSVIGEPKKVTAPPPPPAEPPPADPQTPTPPPSDEEAAQPQGEAAGDETQDPPADEAQSPPDAPQTQTADDQDTVSAGAGG